MLGGFLGQKDYDWKLERGNFIILKLAYLYLTSTIYNMSGRVVSDIHVLLSVRYNTDANIVKYLRYEWM